MPLTLLFTFSNSRLAAELPGLTRGIAGDSYAHVMPDVPAPTPAALTLTSDAYAVASVLMSSMPTVNPLPPGR